MVENADCGLRIADCRLRTGDCGLRTADCGLQIADCGLRYAEKTEWGGVHNFILAKFQYKFLFFMSKYVFQIQYGVWMKKSIPVF